MLAIHHRNNSFSSEWIKYCDENSISYKIVDCFATNVVDQVKDCDAVLWHFHHGKRADMAAAPRILAALEQSGIKVFPNRNTAWHFDDKVAQKYLFDALEIPTIETRVFYDVRTVKKWLETAQLPLVFKSSSGAGASGVKLVHTKHQAFRLAKKSIMSGFPAIDKSTLLKDLTNSGVFKTISFNAYLKKLALLVMPKRFVGSPATETGTALFQQFIPHNDSDVRIIVINHRAFGIRRYVRENDFRASGSGSVSYDMSSISDDTIRLAFDVADKLSSQCCAIDFVYLNDRPLVVEVSYGFTIDAYRNCPGYWTRDLLIQTENFNPYGWMLEQITMHQSKDNHGCDLGIKI